MNITNLTIGARLAVGFGAMAIIALLIGVLAVFGVHTLSANMENIGGNRVPALLALSQLNRQRMTIRAQTQAVFSTKRKPSPKRVRALQEERRTVAESQSGVGGRAAESATDQ